MAGFAITGIVQHSGAVTVATIGFVNAGLLTLAQSLGVIFGSNIGTTMTAWLVSLVGFGFKIEALALPLLAAGVGFKMISRNQRNQFLGRRWRALRCFSSACRFSRRHWNPWPGALPTAVLSARIMACLHFWPSGFWPRF